MKHDLKAGILALIVALLLGPVASAADPEDLQDLQKDVRQLKSEMIRLKRDLEADRLAAAEQARRLDERLERMTRALEKLADISVNRSTSQKITSVAPPSMGTLKLVNDLNVEAQVTIGGSTYTVPGHGTAVVRNMTAGEFSYDVTAVGFGQATHRTTLGSNETLTLTIY